MTYGVPCLWHYCWVYPKGLTDPKSGNSSTKPFVLPASHTHYPKMSDLYLQHQPKNIPSLDTNAVTRALQFTVWTKRTPVVRSDRMLTYDISQSCFASKIESGHRHTPDPHLRTAWSKPCTIRRWTPSPLWGPLTLHDATILTRITESFS